MGILINLITFARAQTYFSRETFKIGSSKTFNGHLFNKMAKSLK